MTHGSCSTTQVDPVREDGQRNHWVSLSDRGGGGTGEPGSKTLCWGQKGSMTATVPCAAAAAIAVGTSTQSFTTSLKFKANILESLSAGWRTGGALQVC